MARIIAMDEEGRGGVAQTTSINPKLLRIIDICYL